MSQFGKKELALRMDVLELGASNGNYSDIYKGSFEVVIRLYLGSEFETEITKAFEIQTRAG